MEHKYNIGDWIWGYYIPNYKNEKWFFQVDHYTTEHDPCDGTPYIMYHDSEHTCCEEHNIEGIMEDTSPEIEEYKLYLTLRKKYEGR